MVKKKDKINKTLAGTYKYQNREIYLERGDIFTNQVKRETEKKGNKKEKKEKEKRVVFG